MVAEVWTMQSLLLVLLTVIASRVVASPNGAPGGACDSMVPAHGVPGQTGASPYSITPSSQSYRCGESVTIRLAADSGNFRGFLCQARTDTSAYSSTVGVLSQSGSVSMKQNCGTGRALTHSERGDKPAAEFTWTPSEDHGPVNIVCSIVQARSVFWIKQSSTVITYDGGCGTTSAANTQSPVNVTDHTDVSRSTIDTTTNDNTNAADIITISSVLVAFATLLQVLIIREP